MAEQVAHVEPGWADADVQVAAQAVLVLVAGQRFGVKTRKRRLAGTGQAAAGRSGRCT